MPTASTTTPAPVAATPSPNLSAAAAPNVPAGLDPTAYILTKAIAYRENGGNAPNYNAASGDDGATPDGANGPLGGGAYQFTTATWQNDAQQILGNATAPMTPENQNQVAYTKVYNWLQAGYSPAQVASMWNAGPGEPNAYTGTFSTGASSSGTNAAGTKYNVPGYVNSVQQYAEQLWNGQTPTPAQSPSVGGFAGNVVKSGANLLGNVGNAILHPIQTVEGIGSAAVGALQEAGGQQNQNTQSFDNVIDYFKNRYGSVSDLENTLYTDPVGVLADLSAAFGGLEGVAGAAGKAAELGTVADAGDAADAALSTGVRTMAGDQKIGNPLTRTIGAAQDALGTASNAVNPLAPIINGVSNLVGKSGVVSSELGSQLTGFEPQTIDKIISNPEEFTPEAIANSSRMSVAQQVEDALGEKMSALDETGAAYAPIRESETPISVAPNFLEEQLRKTAGVDVKDGTIVSTGASKIRDPADVKALQSLLDTWKPEFQDGQLSTNEFLNFRQDLGKVAKYGKEFTASKPVEGVAAAIRDNFNKAYRSQIPGLAENDADFSSQTKELTALRKGLIDKDGNLLDSAVNKIANAGGKGKDLQLEKLEKIVPGISKKLEVLKAMEDIQKAGGTKVGTYPSAFLKAGGIIAGAATGNLKLLGASAATMILAQPGIAVPLLKLLGDEKGIVSATMGHLAKFVTLGTVASRVTSGNSAPQK